VRELVGRGTHQTGKVGEAQPRGQVDEATRQDRELRQPLPTRTARYVLVAEQPDHPKRDALEQRATQCEGWHCGRYRTAQVATTESITEVEHSEAGYAQQDGILPERPAATQRTCHDVERDGDVQQHGKVEVTEDLAHQ
jgi:hypothetical protein